MDRYGERPAHAVPPAVPGAEGPAGTPGQHHYDHRQHSTPHDS